MVKLWAGINEQNYISRHDSAHTHDLDILRQAYATTLLGANNDLTMHGGGNTSIKKSFKDGAGKLINALYVKASGTPLNSFVPEYFVAMDLDYLTGLKERGWIDDETMAVEFKIHQLSGGDKLPSIESLMHAFIQAKIVNHTHPAAILKIVNRMGGQELLQECFGDELSVIPYARMGYDLATAVSEAATELPTCMGTVICHHGLVTWGDDAREAYNKTIDIITKAEEFLAKITSRSIAPPIQKISAAVSAQNYKLIYPIIKERLARALKEIFRKEIQDGEISLSLLSTPDVLDLINSPDGEDIICNPPMTPDYPMLTRILPLWLDIDINSSPQELSSYINEAIDNHIAEYTKYLERKNISSVPSVSLLPLVLIHPRVGAICFGLDDASAQKTADFTRQAFSIRRTIAETGGVYKSLPEEYIFDMQYRGYTQAKKHI